MWFSTKKRIYMDYASAPPVSEAALRAMRDAATYIGNPGAIHIEGADAAAALGSARERIARLLSVKPREIIFTSGLTESNNLAIVGHARALDLPAGRQGAREHVQGLEGTHWLVSAIEHSSVLDCLSEVERLGGNVTFVQPDENGIIEPAAITKALRPETVLVSVCWGNNEIGTLQPLRKIRAVLDEHERVHKSTVLLHSDAGQAPLYEASTAHTLGVDLLSLGGNKLYGPHGIGALFISNRARLARVMLGGPQERKLRPGTESVALALGFAASYEEVAREREGEARRLKKIRDDMAAKLAEYVPGLVVNGDLEKAMPHMLNISIPDIQSEYLTLQLDRAGIAVSTKSACREGEESESHVVAAFGGEPWRAENTIRISLGRDTTERDARTFVDTLANYVGVI